jgi:hypothetical protein
MLLSAVSVLVVAQSSSEILEGLMTNPVYCVDRDTPEICKMPGKRLSLFIGALLGNLESVHLPGFFLEKRNSISGFLSWTQRIFRFYVWGPSGTLGKNRALLSWYQIMGQKGPVFKA